MSKYVFRFLCLLEILRFSFVYGQDIHQRSMRDYWRDSQRKIINIPDIPGYVTLKGDFHMHTVFSDGMVWPVFRVLEAWKEGLDVIAITDHIEFRPHSEYLENDMNNSFKIAEIHAKQNNLLLIKGAEITKSKVPPGHLNAIFIEDVNKLNHEDPMVQIQEAVRQGGFIFWNHPGIQNDSTGLWDFHLTLLEKGWLHGVEVANYGMWYPVALDWCRDGKLTALSNSDIHYPTDYLFDFSQANSHRPMTLVFAKEKTLEGVKEALLNRKTVGFFGDMLLGPEDLIISLFKASVKLNPPFGTFTWQGLDYPISELHNPTDLTFIMEYAENDSGKPIRINLLPRSTVIFGHPVDGQGPIRCKLLNCYSGSNQHPVVEMNISCDE